MPRSGVKGNKGGGRKSSYQEKKDAEWAFDSWKKPTDLEALKTKIKSGHFSARDIYLFKLLTGSEAIMKDLGGKVMADLHDHAMELKEYVITRGIDETSDKPVHTSQDATADH